MWQFFSFLVSIRNHQPVFTNRYPFIRNLKGCVVPEGEGHSLIKVTKGRGGGGGRGGSVQQLKLLPRVDMTSHFLGLRGDKIPHFDCPRANK